MTRHTGFRCVVIACLLTAAGAQVQAADKLAPTSRPAAPPPASATKLKVQYQIPNISAGPNSLVGLKSDGTLVFDGGEKELGVTDENKAEVAGWKDIVQVAPGWHHLAALKKDGTVLLVAQKGAEKYVGGASRWKDIVQLASGYDIIYGLKKDGTVVVAGGWSGEKAAAAGWRDIVAIGEFIGLKKDGTVAVVGDGSAMAGKPSEWKDIVAVAGQGIGLKKDGTVVVAGKTDFREKYGCVIDVSKMTDVVDIKSAPATGVIALRKDGTVVTTGEDNWKQQAMNMNEGAKGAVAITAGEHFFAVLKPDGTIFSVGQGANARNAMGWNLGATAPNAYQVRNRAVGRPSSTQPATAPAAAK